MSIIAYANNLIVIKPETLRETELSNKYGVKSAVTKHVYLVTQPTRFEEKEFINALEELGWQTVLPGFDVSEPITVSGQ